MKEEDSDSTSEKNKNINNIYESQNSENNIILKIKREIQVQLILIEDNKFQERKVIKKIMITKIIIIILIMKTMKILIVIMLMKKK